MHETVCSAGCIKNAAQLKRKQPKVKCYPVYSLHVINQEEGVKWKWEIQLCVPGASTGRGVVWQWPDSLIWA